MKLKILLSIFAASALVVGSSVGVGVGLTLNNSNVDLEKIVNSINWKIDDLFSRPVKTFTSFLNLIANKFQAKYGSDVYNLDFYNGNISWNQIKNNTAIKINPSDTVKLYFNFTVVASKNGILKGVTNVNNENILKIILAASNYNSNDLRRIFVMSNLNVIDINNKSAFQKINENISELIKNNYDNIINALIKNKMISDIKNFTSDIFNLSVLSDNDNDVSLTNNNKSIILGTKIMQKLKYLGLDQKQNSYDLFFPCVQQSDDDVMKVLINRNLKYPKDENQFYFEWQNKVTSDMTILELKNLFSQYFTQLIFDEFGFNFADKNILRLGIFELVIGKSYKFDSTYSDDAKVSDMWGYGGGVLVPYGWILLDNFRHQYKNLKNSLLPNLGQNGICIRMKLGEQSV